MIYHSRKLLYILLVLSFQGRAQEPDTTWMMSWNSAWDDALYEWEINFETPKSEDFGELEATWAHLGDWTIWDYLIDEEQGSITQKWDERDDIWEVRSGTDVTTIRTKWSNDFSEWVIEYNKEITIRWMSRDYHDGNFWYFKDDRYGTFEFYTEFEDDPRDWLVYDDTIDDFPFDIKMACCFIAMYRSTSGFRRK